MISAMFWFGVGLVVGWFFLPAPVAVRDILAKIPFLGKYLK